MRVNRQLFWFMITMISAYAWYKHKNYGLGLSFFQYITIGVYAIVIGLLSDINDKLR